MGTNERKKLKKLPCAPRTAGFLFTVAQLLYLAVGLAFALIFSFVAKDDSGNYPDWYLYLSYLLAPSVFLVVLAVGFRFSEISPREIYAPCRWYYFLIALFLQFGLFSLSRLNELFLSFLGDFGYTGGVSVPSMENGGLFWVILVVGVLPAFFEESIFRGLLLRPLKNTFTPFAAIAVGFVFALYHQNPAQTIYQFFCGSAYALLALRSGSVFPTMAAHLLNNTVILVLTYCGVTGFSTWFYIASAISLVGSLVWLLFDRSNGVKKERAEKISPFFSFFGENGELCGGLGVGLCAFMWLSNLLAGGGG